MDIPKLIQHLETNFTEEDYKDYDNSIEREYQYLCSRFSDAYKSGSDWYVGPTLINHKNYKILKNNIKFNDINVVKLLIMRQIFENCEKYKF